MILVGPQNQIGWSVMANPLAALLERCRLARASRGRPYTVPMMEGIETSVAAETISSAAEPEDERLLTLLDRLPPQGGRTLR